MARKHYGRIVRGIDAMGSAPVYMVTITCKGKGLSRKDAEDGFPLWTNRLLTAYRANHKRGGGEKWAYAAVTERQRRGHPHLHLLIYAVPDDASNQKRYRIIRGNNEKGHREYYDALRSEWLSKAVIRAGFGPEYDIQKLDNPAAGARYVAKYLFKSLELTDWPAHWRRIRYSQSWPDSAEAEADNRWYPIITNMDWLLLKHDSNRVIAYPSDDIEYLTERIGADKVRVISPEGVGDSFSNTVVL